MLWRRLAGFAAVAAGLGEAEAAAEREERLRRWLAPPSLEGEAGRRLWLVMAAVKVMLLLPRLWRVVWRLAGRLTDREAGREAVILGVETETAALGMAKGLWLWLC
jgi:hypothetical protein